MSQINKLTRKNRNIKIKNLKNKRKTLKRLKKNGGTDLKKIKKIWNDSANKYDNIESKYTAPLDKDGIWSIREKEKISEFNPNASEFIPNDFIENKPKVLEPLQYIPAPPPPPENSHIIYCLNNYVMESFINAKKFGFLKKHIDLFKNVKDGTPLILLNLNKRTFYGIFEASGPVEKCSFLDMDDSLKISPSKESDYRAKELLENLNYCIPIKPFVKHFNNLNSIHYLTIKRSFKKLLEETVIFDASNLGDNRPLMGKWKYWWQLPDTITSSAKANEGWLRRRSHRGHRGRHGRRSIYSFDAENKD